MMAPPKDYEVGYKRPPTRTRWKKGQSGNPLRRYTVKPLPSALETVDHHLLRMIEVVEKGVSKKVTVLEAIILQLWQKELAGDRRAIGVRLKFEEIGREAAGQGIDVRLIESDYTRMLDAARPLQGDSDE